MPELENPAENPCFGCGPANPRGLRLRFERAEREAGGSEVRTKFTPQPDEIGWPTLFHHGLHFMVLYEASYWAALTLAGRLWVSVGPVTYTADRLPRVGRSYVARASLTEQGPEALRIRATTESGDGKPCGSLDSHWRPASRRVVERAEIPLPEYLRSELSP
jgi:hypothetical protein